MLFYVTIAKSSIISLASIAIHFKPNFNRNMAKTCLNNDILQPLTLSMIFYTPYEVKSWIRHWKKHMKCF